MLCAGVKLLSVGTYTNNEWNDLNIAVQYPPSADLIVTYDDVKSGDFIVDSLGSVWVINAITESRLNPSRLEFYYKVVVQLKNIDVSPVEEIAPNVGDTKAGIVRPNHGFIPVYWDNTFVHLNVLRAAEEYNNKAYTPPLFNINPAINYDYNNPPSSPYPIGGVIIGTGLDVNTNGLLTVSLSPGLQFVNNLISLNLANPLIIDNSNQLNIKIGTGLAIDSSGNLVNTVTPGSAISAAPYFDYANQTVGNWPYPIGGVTIGKGFDVDQGGLLEARLGQGLYFDLNNAIAVQTSSLGMTWAEDGIMPSLGSGLKFDTTLDPTTNTYPVMVKLGTGLAFDTDGSIYSVSSGPAPQFDYVNQTVGNTPYPLGSVTIGKGLSVSDGLVEVSAARGLIINPQNQIDVNIYPYGLTWGAGTEVQDIIQILLGKGLMFDPVMNANNEHPIMVDLGNGLQFSEGGNSFELKSAILYDNTMSLPYQLGGVIVNLGLTIDNTGLLDILYSDGLTIDSNGALAVNLMANKGLSIVGGALRSSIASNTTLGSITVGNLSGLIVDQYGMLDINYGAGLATDENNILHLTVYPPLSFASGQFLQLDYEGCLAVSTGNKLFVNVTDPFTINGLSQLELKVGTGLLVDATGTLVCTVTSSSGSSYTLPIASATVLGGIKVGTGLSIDIDGILSSTITSYSLPIASATVLGGIKVGNGLAIDGTGTLSSTIIDYSLPMASIAVLGGIKIGSSLTIDTNGVVEVNQYHIAGGFFDVPVGGAVVHQFIFPGGLIRTLPATLPYSTVFVGINPTARTTLAIYKNSGQIGSIVINTDGTYSFGFSSSVIFNTNDVLKVVNQATADATLANVTWTFATV